MTLLIRLVCDPNGDGDGGGGGGAGHGPTLTAVVQGMELEAYDAAFYMESSLHCENRTQTFAQATHSQPTPPPHRVLVLSRVVVLRGVVVVSGCVVGSQAYKLLKPGGRLVAMEYNLLPG